jgi:hypothetical protein
VARGEKSEVEIHIYCQNWFARVINGKLYHVARDLELSVQCVLVFNIDGNYEEILIDRFG